MFREIAGNWWMFVVRGVFAILFGIVAWTWPGVTLGVLIMLWALYAFADGVFAFAAALSGRTNRPWWILLLEGVVGLGAAGAAIFYPGVTAVVLLYVIAGWALAKGALEIAAAIQLRKEIHGELWLALAGIASLIFGLLIIRRPELGALAVVWIIGVYAVAFGVVLIALGFRVRSLKNVALPL